MTHDSTLSLETQLRQTLKAGLSNNPQQAIREALLLLEQNQIDRLNAALATGIAQSKQGNVIELTPDVWDEIEREADEADRLGLPIDPDVRP